MMKKTLCALALFGAAAAAQAEVILQENFNSVPALGASGWLNVNQSTPALGAAWLQGNADILSAHSGAANSYAASSFLSSDVGGMLNNWLISPVFSTEKLTQISIWLQADAFAGFADHLSFGVSNGSGNTADFSLQPSFVVNTGGWQQYTFEIGPQGVGSTARFALNYTGAADESNYVGVDDFSVNAVPEPASMMILGAGLLGLAAARRRQRK